MSADTVEDKDGPAARQYEAELDRLIEKAAKAEREYCAKIADAFAANQHIDGDRTYCNGYRHAAERIAKAIREGVGRL